MTTTTTRKPPVKNTKPARPAPRAPQLIKVTDPASQTARRKAATAESKTLKAWTDAGSKGRRPVTPNLDAINAQYENGGAAKVLGGSKTKMAPGLRFFHDDKRIADSSNKLSSLAYQYTRGVDKDAVRISTDSLRAVLKRSGVSDPESSEWEVTLKNGVKLSAKFEAKHARTAA